MSETTMSRTEQYERQAAAHRALEEARAELDRAQRRVGVLGAELRTLSGKRGRTAESGHRRADALQEAAEERFRAGLRDYLTELRTDAREAPDPPPPSLLAAFVAARGGEEFYAALHRAIDDAVDDSSTSAFDIATEAEVEEAMAAKQRALSEARERVSEWETALEQAESAYHDAASGGR